MKLEPAPAEVLAAVSAHWPLGLERLADGRAHGLVVQRDTREVLALTIIAEMATGERTRRANDFRRALRQRQSQASHWITSCPFRCAAPGG